MKPNLMNSAVIGVDDQDDFRPRGALAVPNGHQVTGPLNRMILWAGRNRRPVVLSRDWHKKDTPHFKKWPAHCIENTPGARFDRDLYVLNSAIRVSKGLGDGDGYSPFETTNIELHIKLYTEWLPLKIDNLKQLLDSLKVTTNYIGGLATDYCVRAAVLDSIKNGFITVFLSDASRAVDLNPGDGDRAIEEMRAAGAIVTTTEEVLNARS